MEGDSWDTREAFDREILRAGALVAGPALLGAILLRRGADPGDIRAGVIVETEAYTADDAASHSFRGETPRTGAMFAAAGLAYIHINYGIHRCLNIVTGESGDGQAVLIRAIWPVLGIDAMRQSRQWHEPKPLRGLADGPGKLTQALEIGTEWNGRDLLDPNGDLRLCQGAEVPIEDMEVTARIGITKAADLPRRFLVSVAAYPRITQLDR